MKSEKRVKNYIFLRRMLPLAKGEWGGLEKLMFDWFERIDYQKVNVIVAVTKGWKERFEEEAQKKNLPLSVVEFPMNFDEGNIKCFLAAYGFFRQFRLDGVVFFQAHYADFNVGEILAASLTAKGNVFMHENLGPLEPPVKTSKKHFGFIPGLGLWWHYQVGMINMRSRIVKAVLVVSQEIKNRYVEWWGYVKDKVIVAYHGVETCRFAPSAQIRQQLRMQLNIKPADIIMIVVARLSAQKRIDRVIEAFDILANQFSALRLLIVGGGPLEQELKGLAASKSCSGKVRFLGHINDVSNYLQVSDIYVMSSDNEGFGIALVEAMAAGLICVSTKCPGPNEIIQDGVNGFLVERSMEGVLGGLRQAVELSAERRKTMRDRAVHFVKENFEINEKVRSAFSILGLEFVDGSGLRGESALK